MKISVITITCRNEPRLAEMAKTLAYSLASAEPDAELEWIIVDDHAEEEGEGTIRSTAGDLLDHVVSANVLRRFTAKFIRPLPSAYRGPEAASRAPAHNSARNAGLFAATGEYIVFLNDCSIVTAQWVQLAIDCARAGKGWKSKQHTVHDVPMPDAPFRFRDHHDLLRKVITTTVGGSCWGAPRSAFMKIHGFDLAYDGEMGGHDLDAIVRLGRTGLAFVTSERAYTVRLRRTLSDTEISINPETRSGKRNIKLYNDLVRDRDRILPVLTAHGPEDELGRADVERAADRVAGRVVVPPAAKPSREDRRLASQRLPGVADAAPSSPAAVPSPDSRGPSNGAVPPLPGDAPADDDADELDDVYGSVS